MPNVGVKYAQSPVCLYSIRDDLAGQWGPVFEAVNDSVALREYARIMSKVDQKSDYRLIRLGSFLRDGDFINGSGLGISLLVNCPVDISDALASDDYIDDGTGIFVLASAQEAI